MEKNNININWGAITEIMALFILGIIAIVAMLVMSVDGKEIALSIGSGVCGYLAKAAIDENKKEGKEPTKDDKIA